MESLNPSPLQKLVYSPQNTQQTPPMRMVWQNGLKVHTAPLQGVSDCSSVDQSLMTVRYPFMVKQTVAAPVNNPETAPLADAVKLPPSNSVTNVVQANFEKEASVNVPSVAAIVTSQVTVPKKKKSVQRKISIDEAEWINIPRERTVRKPVNYWEPVATQPQQAPMIIKKYDSSCQCHFCTKVILERSKKSGTWKNCVERVLRIMSLMEQGRRLFNLKTEILPYMDFHWEMLWSRKKAGRWDMTVGMTLSKYAVFSKGSNELGNDGVGYWGLKHFDAARDKEILLSNADTSDKEAFGRRDEIDCDDNDIMTEEEIEQESTVGVEVVSSSKRTRSGEEVNEDPSFNPNSQRKKKMKVKQPRIKRNVFGNKQQNSSANQSHNTDKLKTLSAFCSEQLNELLNGLNVALTAESAPPTSLEDGVLMTTTSTRLFQSFQNVESLNPLQSVNVVAC